MRAAPTPPIAPRSAEPSARLLVFAFASVYLIWGSTYLAIRFAIETLPTFTMIGVRFLAGGAAMLAYAGARGESAPSARQWRDGAITGILMMGGGTGTVAWAEHRIHSNVAALMVATLPLWMVVLEGLRTRTRGIAPHVAIGIALGFGGVALMVKPAGDAVVARDIDPLGAGSVLAATLFWAMGSIYARHAPLPRSPFVTAGMQTACGGTALILFGLLAGEGGALDWRVFSAKSVLALLYLIVLGNGAFIAYAWLLKVSTPARVSTYAYVNPLVAIVLGWMLADEILTPVQLAGAGLIVAAVALIIKYNRPRSPGRVHSKERA
ncbi:MAG: EamA family transporter [Candidatus Krumholzibacteria bacterium]|nr:EamA family transporter [Candidatus Krumholzibacteria bacterium]